MQRLRKRMSAEDEVFLNLTDHQRFLVHRHQKEQCKVAKLELEAHMMLESKQAAKLAEAEQNLALTENPVACAYKAKCIELVKEEMDELVTRRRPFVTHLGEEVAVYRGQEPFMQVKPHLYRLFTCQVGQKQDAWIEHVTSRVIYYLAGNEMPLLLACKWEGNVLLKRLQTPIELFALRYRNFMV